MRTILLLLLASFAFAATPTVDKVSGVSSANIGAIGPTAIAACGSITSGAAFAHGPPPEFIIVVDTTKAGSAAKHFVLPCSGSGYDADVDWGDGGAHNTLSGTPGNVDHTYPADGTYTVKIKENSVGGFPTIHFNNSGDKLKLLQISQWGTNKWITLSSAFYGCSNLTITATDAATANTGSVTSFSLAWYGCTGLTNFPLIDTHAGTSFSTAWCGCTGLTNFPLIDTHAGTNFSYAWQGCTGLNGYAFPTLNMRAVTNGTSCFSGVTLQTAAYSNIIIDMALGVTNNVTFHGGGSHYNAGAVTAHDVLTVTRTWTITDGGTP
jgi:hypothetical protein